MPKDRGNAPFSGIVIRFYDSERTGNEFAAHLIFQSSLSLERKTNLER